jgi:hypothetical protein
MISVAPSPLEIIGLRRPTRGSDDLKAQLRQQGDGDTADAAGSTGHQYGSATGLDPVSLQRQHAEHGGVSGRADRHAFSGGDLRQHFQEPIALDAGHLRVAAEMRLAHTPAVQDHRIAGLNSGWEEETTLAAKSMPGSSASGG